MNHGCEESTEQFWLVGIQIQIQSICEAKLKPSKFSQSIIRK